MAGLKVKRVAIFLMVVFVVSFLASYPHELGHKVAANALGYDGTLIFEGVMPAGFVMTTHLKDIPPAQAFIIGVAGGLAVALAIVGFLFVVKNSVVKEALKLIVVMSLVYAVVEGASAVLGITDYTVLLFVWEAYVLVVFELSGIISIRKVLGG